MRATFLAAAVVVAGVVAAAAPAHAQGYGPGYYAGPPPPPPGVVRSGFIAGVGIGGGGFGITDCEDCDGLGVIALRGHLGGMLSPSIALVFDAEWVAGKPEDDLTVSQFVGLAALRVWLGRIFWLQVGIGVAQLAVTSDALNLTLESDTGGAGMIGFGIELMQRPSFTIDIQGRLTATRYGDNDEADDLGIAGGTLLVGFNWY